MLFGLFKAARRKWRTARKRRRIRSCVVSFPKAGRTWLRMMIGKALAEQFGLNEGDALDHIERLAKRAGAPPFDFTHDGDRKSVV